MNNLENYAAIINDIFGPASSTFKTNSSATNKVIGALNFPNDFEDFKVNFYRRLERLKSIYENHPAYMKDILVQVNLIANTKNWDGAYAELATYDHFNADFLQSKNLLAEPIAPNVTLDKEKSLGFELGMQETNLDGYVSSIGLYFDVKVLKDNVDEILKGIYKQIQKKYRNLYSITAEYDLGISHSKFEHARTALVDEISDALLANGSLSYLPSSVVTGLSFQFYWQRGNTFTTRTYHPHLHAKNHHRNMFNYVKKFLKVRPTIIVMVSFPWYNQILNGSSENNLFYRAYARRVFCQYQNDNSPFKNWDSDFTGGQTFAEVSRHLSGIIFLEDNSILSKTPDETNVKCCVYLNPNANHNLIRSFSQKYLHLICNTEYDDFNFDNY